MTKSELIARLAEKYPQLVAKDADFAVKTILDAMADALASGQRIEIRGFGSFALNSRPPRIGRNPKSGDKVMVPENGYRTSSRARNCANVSMPWWGNPSRMIDLVLGDFAGEEIRTALLGAVFICRPPRPQAGWAGRAGQGRGR